MLVPLAVRIHEPTLIGEVILNMRSMLMKRKGRPRSEESSNGLTLTDKSEMPQALLPSSSLPRSSEKYASPADAPARPPVKR